MRWRHAIAAAALALGASACQQPLLAAEKAVEAPAAKRAAKEGSGLKTAIFAGGCFWGVEGVFSHVRGVTSAVSGYHGGTERQAHYKLVSSGITDHAEAVRVTYDPKVIRYDQLLRIFFSVVTDPTQIDLDFGARPFAEQNAVAKAYLAQLRSVDLWDKPIVTRIERAQAFYPAETYHQDFMLKNPRHRYIVRWDAPKVKALKALYPGAYSARFQPD